MLGLKGCVTTPSLATLIIARVMHVRVNSVTILLGVWPLVIHRHKYFFFLLGGSGGS